MYKYIYKGMIHTYIFTRLVTHRNCQMMSKTRGLNHTVYVVWWKLLQQGEPTTILHPLSHFARKALQIGWHSQIKCGLLWIVYDWIISHDALGAFQSTVSWWITHYTYWPWWDRGSFDQLCLFPFMSHLPKIWFFYRCRLSEMEWYFKWIPLNIPNFQHGTQKKCCLESSGIHFLFRAWIWHDMAIHGFDAHNFLDKKFVNIQ